MILRDYKDMILIRVVIAFIAIYCISISVASGNNKYSLFSIGTLNEYIFSYKKDVVDDLDVHGIYKISDYLQLDGSITFNKKTKKICFPAINLKTSVGYTIYCAEYKNSKLAHIGTAKKITQGHKPDISPSGTKLVFKNKKDAYVFEFEGEKIAKTDCEISSGTRAIWLNDFTLLYADNKDQLVKFDIFNKTVSKTGYYKIYPGTASSDGKMVLLISYEGRTIYLYNVLTNELKVVMKNKHLNYGSDFVWLDDGKSFFYSKQNHEKLFFLNQSRDLYIYSLASRKEKKILDNFELLGGFMFPYKDSDN